MIGRTDGRTWGKVAAPVRPIRRRRPSSLRAVPPCLLVAVLLAGGCATRGGPQVVKISVNERYYPRVGTPTVLEAVRQTCRDLKIEIRYTSYIDAYTATGKLPRGKESSGNELLSAKITRGSTAGRRSGSTLQIHIYNITPSSKRKWTVHLFDTVNRRLGVREVRPGDKPRRSGGRTRPHRR